MMIVMTMTGAFLAHLLKGKGIVIKRKKKHKTQKEGGYVSLGRKNGQSYFDLEVDPSEVSSWFQEMVKPLEESDIAPYYPMQGASWGNVR